MNPLIFKTIKEFLNPLYTHRSFLKKILPYFSFEVCISAFFLIKY